MTEEEKQKLFEIYNRELKDRIKKLVKYDYEKLKNELKLAFRRRQNDRRRKKEIISRINSKTIKETIWEEVKGKSR